MATYTTQLKSWKSGLNSQIKAIRLALAHGDGNQLAADMSALLGDGANQWNKTHVRSWNTAMQREFKAQNKANKMDDGDVYGLSLNDDKTAVVFGLAKVADNKKAKCPMLSAIAKLKAEKKDTPEAVKTIVTLIESYINAQ